MPEATEDAVFLIATSWQALGRASQGDEYMLTCNCTVVLIFAAFYIEENLTHIIKEMGKHEEMKGFVGGAYPGLYPKLSWFFNKFEDGGTITNNKKFFKKKFRNKLYQRFPGFDEIYEYRNSIAHGGVDTSIANLDDAKRLRGNAKDIVFDLFNIAAREGHEIPRNITYQMATANLDGIEERDGSNV